MEQEQKQALREAASKAYRCVWDDALTWATLTGDNAGGVFISLASPETILTLLDAAEAAGVPKCLDYYNAGLLGDYGGGDIDWWHQYIRIELARAYDFYQSQFAAAPSPAGAEPKCTITAAFPGGQVAEIPLEKIIADKTAEIDKGLIERRGTIDPWGLNLPEEWTGERAPLPERTTLLAHRPSLTFDQIESCFPEGGSTSGQGEIVVSAQWLHDFANNVARLMPSARQKGE